MTKTRTRRSRARSAFLKRAVVGVFLAVFIFSIAGIALVATH